MSLNKLFIYIIFEFCFLKKINLLKEIFTSDKNFYIYYILHLEQEIIEITFTANQIKYCFI